MGFLKALLICQIFFVIGMASTSEASIIRAGIQLVVKPAIRIVRFFLTLPIRLLIRAFRILVKVVVGTLRGIAELTESLFSVGRHRPRRSLPDMPAQPSELAATNSKVNLLGPGGMLVAASKYVA
ncbi:uncharacterized protein [Atheta coriaria]|uniref:uncharacterized protein n=1 Tax=Dalotia coriaria TaxID=877792 RepID=UPI0031F337D3